MADPSASGQPKRVVHSTFHRRQAKRNWFCGCLGAILVSAFAIPAAEGGGTVEFASARTIDVSALDVVRVVAADIDGDGDSDIVAAMYAGGKIVWYENLDGKGTFAGGDEITNLETPTSIAVEDLDGDGYPDVVATFHLESATWFKNADGVGGFSTGYDIATGSNGWAGVTAADFDGDGDLDVVTASRIDDRVAWFENTDGGGTFGVGIDVSTSADGSDMAVAADLDGDGDNDIVAVSTNDNRVTWYENSDGKGAFSLGVDLAVDVGEATYITVADLDGDDDLDVISAGYDDGRLVWHENTDGAGTFASGQDIGVLDSAMSVVAVDLDGDGDVDVVACDYDGGRVVWYENTNGSGSFSAAIDIALDVGVYEVIAVDLDGDGDLDLVSASREKNVVLWYENLVVSGDGTTSLGNAASSSGSSIPTTPAPTEATTPAPVVPLVTTTSGQDGNPGEGATPAPSVPERATSTPAPVVPLVTTTSGQDGNPEEGTTPAPSVPERATSSGEGGDGDGSRGIDDDAATESPVGTPAPAVVAPLTANGSSTGEDDSSDEDRWADAAWEVAVSVIGGILVAGLSALVVTGVHKVIKRRNDAAADERAKSNSAIIHIHNHVPSKNGSGELL